MGVFEEKVGDRNPSKLQELEAIAWEDWNNIAAIMCREHDKNYKKTIIGNNKK